MFKGITAYGFVGDVPRENAIKLEMGRTPYYYIIGATFSLMPQSTHGGCLAYPKAANECCTVVSATWH